MRFAQPQFLWMLLLAVPLLAAFFFWSWRVKQKLITQFVSSRLLGTLTVGLSPARQKFRLVLLAVAVAAVLLALAGPQLGYAWEEAAQRGLDIVMVVDTSRSMLATDVVPNRIEKAKLAVYDLMRRAREDRLGLVPFAGTAFLQCPLTLDEQAFRQSVDALRVGIIPQGGTALSAAIRTAQTAFEKNNNNHKVIVLFTDGEDHDADAETLGAAKEAAEAGVNIFTVGVGTAAGELLQVTDEKGNKSFVKDDEGNVVKSHLNESLLRQIATATGGFYLPLVGADPMDVLYQRGLAPLPKSVSTTKLTRVFQERYHWPLTFAVLCLVAEMLLPDRSKARRGEMGAGPSNPAAVKTAAAILCALCLPMAARALSPGAFDKYQSGDFQGAFDEYSRLAAKKTNDYRLQYDAGTAAYRARQLDDAQKQLGAALNSPDIVSDLTAQEHAYYNLGNTLYHLGEPAPDPKQKQERWEQAIANYSKALQLNTNDVDARNNLAFVKRKLEELKQQQQQQQQKDQKDPDQKDQKDQKQQQSQQNQDQKNQDQKNQDQKSQQSQQQQNGGQSQQQQAQDQKSEEEKQQEQQAQKDQQDQQNKSGQATPAGQDQRDKSADQNQQVASATEAQMTLQEAQRMLDAQKEDEQSLIFTPENKPAQPADSRIKDW